MVVVRKWWVALGTLAATLLPAGALCFTLGLRLRASQLTPPGAEIGAPDSFALQRGDLVLLATIMGCALLLKWCVDAGDANVRARRGIPVLPVLAGASIICFAGGIAAGLSVLFTGMLVCLAVYRVVLRLASGGYSTDGSWSGADGATSANQGQVRGCGNGGDNLSPGAASRDGHCPPEREEA